MSSIDRNRTYSSIIPIWLCALTASCATSSTKYVDQEISPANQLSIASQPEILRPKFEKLMREGERNRVLNHMEIGLAAYRAEHFEASKKSFDSAIREISAIYADSEDARKARSLWHEEGGKNFKGEPYERAMIFFYRGMLFLRDADYENARASFINGIMQDAFAEEEQNKSDFALFLYLAGWAAMQMGSHDLAQSHFDELKLYRPDFDQPPDDHDLLVIVETGRSPRKLADGVGHYELVYRRGKNFSENRVKIEYDNLVESAYPIEDIFFQASTRGGREVDKIIKGKAVFKKKTQAFGSSLSNLTNNSVMAGNASLYGSSGTKAFGALTAISVASMALSAKANPRADTRYWSSLPDTVHVKTFKYSEDHTQLKALFLDKNDTEYASLNKSVPIQFNSNGVGLAHTSSR